jgi:hypothetical protein
MHYVMDLSVPIFKTGRDFPRDNPEARNAYIG